jgi:hypothetical protein
MEKKSYLCASLVLALIYIFSFTLNVYAMNDSGNQSVQQVLGIQPDGDYSKVDIATSPEGSVIMATVEEPSKIGGCLKGDRVKLINLGNGEWDITRLANGNSFQFAVHKDDGMTKITKSGEFDQKVADSTIYKKRSYLAVGGGSGGDADAANMSFEIGSAEKYLFGLGFTYIFSDDDIPSDTLDYPVPHSDYTKLGTKQDGEWGLYGMLGIDIFKGFYLFGLGGVTFQKEIELAQSNVTGYYTQSDEYQTHGMYGGGIRLGLGETLCLQVELDNRRGVTGMIGFVW